jgi:multidrug transporter EmrE-like cation transporter
VGIAPDRSHPGDHWRSGFHLWRNSAEWWAETDRWPGLVIGLVVYSLALIIFALLLRRAELAVIFALWVGVAAVLLALAGWWFFDEALSLRRLAGLTLVIGGMILLGTAQFQQITKARGGSPDPPPACWIWRSSRNEAVSDENVD